MLTEANFQWSVLDESRASNMTTQRLKYVRASTPAASKMSTSSIPKLHFCRLRHQKQKTRGDKKGLKTSGAGGRVHVTRCIPRYLDTPRHSRARIVWTSRYLLLRRGQCEPGVLHHMTYYQLRLTIILWGTSGWGISFTPRSRSRPARRWSAPPRNSTRA